MADTLAIDIAGERLCLHADRALSWPARRRLLLADLHLGKGDILRAAGIAVPSGGSAHDLARLEALIAQVRPSALWILGDFLHGARTSGGWRARWEAFRQRHHRLQIVLLAGNHDRAVPGAGLELDWHPGDLVDGPFRFGHAPSAAPAADGRHRICGHLHPVARLPGLPGRFPAFVRAPHQLVLPAFSAFTGGMLAAADLPRVACAGGHLVAIPPAAVPAPRRGRPPAASP